MMHRCLNVPNIITKFRHFDNVFICLQMFLVLSSLQQRQHKMQSLRKLKSANSLLTVYRPANEQRFYLVYISDIIYIRSHYESKVRNVIAFVFIMSLSNSVYLL